MNKRQELALETRKKLIKSAKDIITEKGFKETSIEDITKNAHVATGTFYTYFKTKEEVVNEIGFSNFEDLKNTVLNMEESIDKKLEYYFREFMKLVEEFDVEICRQWIINNLSLNKLNKIGYDTNTLKEILQKSVESNDLKPNTPIDNLTDYIICILYGMMVNWCMTDKKFEPLDHCNDFSKIVYDTLKQYINE